MPRNREFVEDQVLDAAITVFWRSGFEGASIADLEKGTKLARGSIYKAFGDKHQFFVKALSRYLVSLDRQLSRTLKGALPVKEALLASVQRTRSARLAGTHGCLALNTDIEFGNTDEDIRLLLDGHHGHTLKLLTKRLELAQSTGELLPDFCPHEIAELFLIWQMGLLVRCPEAIDDKQIEILTARFVDLLSP